MESRTNFYPVYVSGQYLTSEHLNETHDFLWGEERATRYLIIGNGIAKGLDVDFTSTTVVQKVSITGGAAATIDGYILQAATDISCNKAVPVNLVWYTTSDMVQSITDQVTFNDIKSKLTLANQVALTGYEIFPDTTDSNLLPNGSNTIESFAISVSDATSKYVVFATVQITQLQNNQCKQGDCNTKGIQQNYSVRYFLINNSQVPQQNTTTPELPTCGVARIKNLSASGSKQGFYQKAYDAWGKCYAELNPYFTDNTGQQLKIIANLLNSSAQAALATSTTKFGQINSSITNANCPQYYALFGSDLAQAINELVVFYNDYARRYFATSPARIEQTIILGGLRSTWVDKWRYYFISNLIDSQKQSDTVKLTALFNRVLALVDNFILQGGIGIMAAKVVGRPLETPTVIGDTLLQNCAIPYYYDITASGNANTILKYWNPQGGSLRNIYCYYDSIVASRTTMKNKSAAANWFNNNFFRIEGHVGMQKDSAIQLITSMISNEGLPVQLIDCDINYKGPTNWYVFYLDFVTKMKGWVTDLRKDTSKNGGYAYDRMKIIQDKVNQTSYRNMTDVVKLVNDFNAYSNVFLKAPSGAQKVKSIISQQSAIPSDAYGHFQSVIKTADVKAINDGMKAAASDFTDPKAKKLIVLSDLVDLEFMGGAPRGGTFVLLHDGANVIGDGCLPYYYRVGQVRVFDQ